MTLKQTVRKAAKQGNLVPAIVRAIYHGKVTVQLSGNGAIMRMLTLTGGPVEIGQWIHVDFTTNPPLAVAPSPLAVPILDGGRKAAVAKRTPLASPPPRPPAIEVFPGPPPIGGKPDTYPKASYPVTAAGLQAAADICSDGDVIYIPACDMTIGQIDIPSQDTMTTKAVSDITVIGVSQTSTILRGGPVVTFNTVTFRDISFIYEVDSAVTLPINVACYSDANFYNCFFRSWNYGSADSICVANYLGSVGLRFYACYFESNNYGLVLNPDGRYSGLVSQYSAMSWFWGGGTPTESIDYEEADGRKAIEWLDRDLNDPSYYLYENMIYSINYPMRKRMQAYDIVVKMSMLVGSITSGSPIHWMENLDRWESLGGEWPFSPRDFIESADNTVPEYINDVLDADGYPYDAGDTITYRLDTTLIPGQYFPALFFGSGLYRDNAHDIGVHNMRFDEIYLEFTDGTRDYLYPRKDYAYCEDCIFTSGSVGDYHIYANTGSLVEVARTSYDVDKTWGTVIVLSNGHRGVLTSGSEPDFTYSGMEWYDPVTESFYVRNGTDTGWIELALASGSGGGGVSYLANLLDVNTTGMDDTEALCYDQASGKWVPRAQLQFSGLTKVTVSSGSPANPSSGDIWIDSSGSSPAGGGGSVATDSIFDAKGDLPVGTGANTASKLTVGSNGQVLTADSAESTGVKWATIAGVLPLDMTSGSGHAKDDEFSGTSLDAKWTNPATSTRTLTLAVSNGFLTLEPSEAGTGSTSSRGGFGIRQSAPTGSFTIMAKILNTGHVGDEARVGIFVARTADNKGHILGNLRGLPRIVNADGFTYSESADWGAYDGFDSYVAPDWPIVVWMKIVWNSSAGSFSFYYSADGWFWTLLTTRTGQSQPDRIGIAMWANTANIYADHVLACDWFRVTEP